VEKSKVMRISRQRSPVQIIRDQRQPENVEYFNCLISIITNDATCACELIQDCHEKSSNQQEEDSFHKQIWT